MPLDFLAENKTYCLELFTDDSTATTPSKVRIDTAEIKRGHVIERPVATRNGFTAIPPQ